MYQRAKAILCALILWLMILGEALAALAWLAAKGAAVLGREGKSGLGAFLTAPATQIRIFRVLRAFLPNLSIGKVVMKCYGNTGTAVVTRRADVLDVLNRNEEFEVVYGTRMRKLTGGENFFLGMQPGWDYTRDTSAMRLAAQRTDVLGIVAPRARELSTRIVAESGGRIDLPVDLGMMIPWDMTEHYFGVGGQRELMESWTTTLFWYLFEDLTADPALDSRAMKDAAELRDYLDRAIAARKASGEPWGHVILDRCLALQSAGTPGMSDLGIRNNLLGLLIGAIPTISKACCLAMDELLNRPEALASAHQAAVRGDHAAVAQHIWEALRFNPHNPVIYRRATRDAWVAKGTARQCLVKRGQIVFAATLSAMFDRHEIADPNAFRTDRPWEDYIIWGYGMHECFGAAINAAVIPEILTPLLAQKNLRRAPGSDGQVDGGGTPHPQHFHLEFDV
ncbi:cytochrome P450 [Mangrovicoccus sp. HB161399]|uniref:cytochrome P450 n=1 Tax=Mangrovicoccus sp. HB161399 TaxID=2720392 RepID=UPI0020A662B3|nr:cytochrome P450 [Mangrovicoccus sp. HB161399]